MKRFRPFLLAAFAVTSLTGCVRDRIMSMDNSYRLTYDIDYDVLYNAPAKADLLKVGIYHPDTHKRLSADRWGYPSGNELQIVPGNYSIVAYTYQNNSTVYTYTDRLDLLTAETESMTLSDGSKVIAMPSHFFVGLLDDCHLPYVAEGDAPYEISMKLKSPLQSWRVVVTGIRQLEYARSMTFYITDQYEDLLLYSMEGEGCATMQFSGAPDVTYSEVIGDFNTFGFVPDGKYKVTVILTDQADQTFSRTVDFTDVITATNKGTLLNDEHILTFDYDVTLSKMVQGGLDPDVDDWDTEYQRWTIH